MPITCPKCGKTSYNAQDVANRYCGYCHQFHDTMPYEGKMKQHTYPPSYRPGPQQHWALNEAWRLLDQLDPGAMSETTRFLLAGMITASLIETEKGGRGPGVPRNQSAG